MATILDISGQRFSRLLVIEFYERKGLQSIFKCKCDCGNIAFASSNNLKKGTTRSCGCLQRDMIRDASTTHGKSGSKNPEYRAWKHMKNRCRNKKGKKFKNHGGRGIKVSDRWLGEHGFENFLSDMGPKPSDLHSLDRYPDNDGDYGPTNCRWATTDEQNKNKRNNRWLEYMGTRMIMADWARRFGVIPETLREHLEKKSFPEVVAFYENKSKTFK